MYSLVCKVMIRLDTGDKVVFTGKSNKEEKNKEVLERLKKDIMKDAPALVPDTLYYTIRVTKNEVKDNWKCDKLDDVYTLLDEIFN